MTARGVKRSPWTNPYNVPVEHAVDRGESGKSPIAELLQFAQSKATATGAPPPGMPSFNDLNRRWLQPEQSPAARLSAMMRQDYARPEPAVPDYPPLRGFGYRIPIIPPKDRIMSSLPGMSATPDTSLPVRPFVPVLKVKPTQSFSLERIGKAATRAVGKLFEPPLGASDEAMGPLINQEPEDFEGPLGLIRTFNKALIQGGSKALDAAGRTAFAPVVGGIAALTQTAQEAGMSRTDARRLERDLHGIALSVGAVSGTVFGKGLRVPSRYRVVTEAAARGVLDRAVSQLPRHSQAGAKQKLREAFDAGESAGKKALEERSVAEGTAGRARKAKFVPKPPLTKLPEVSYTVNPMTADEFSKLPPKGKVNPHRIRTSQDTNGNEFRADSGKSPRKSVLETTNELRTIPNKEDAIPEIRIFELNGKVFTLDHRRLVSHRLADVPIKYRKASPAEVRRGLSSRGSRNQSKMSTTTDGMSIGIVEQGGRGKRQQNDG